MKYNLVVINLLIIYILFRIRKKEGFFSGLAKDMNQDELVYPAWMRSDSKPTDMPKRDYQKMLNSSSAPWDVIQLSRPNGVHSLPYLPHPYTRSDALDWADHPDVKSQENPPENIVEVETRQECADLCDKDPKRCVGFNIDYSSKYPTLLCQLKTHPNTGNILNRCNIANESKLPNDPADLLSNTLVRDTNMYSYTSLDRSEIDQRNFLIDNPKTSVLKHIHLDEYTANISLGNEPELNYDYNPYILDCFKDIPIETCKAKCDKNRKCAFMIVKKGDDVSESDWYDNICINDTMKTSNVNCTLHSTEEVHLAREEEETIGEGKTLLPEPSLYPRTRNKTIRYISNINLDANKAQLQNKINFMNDNRPEWQAQSDSHRGDSYDYNYPELPTIPDKIDIKAVELLDRQYEQLKTEQETIPEKVMLHPGVEIHSIEREFAPGHNPWSLTGSVGGQSAGKEYNLPPGYTVMYDNQRLDKEGYGMCGAEFPYGPDENYIGSCRNKALLPGKLSTDLVPAEIRYGVKRPLTCAKICNDIPNCAGFKFDMSSKFKELFPACVFYEHVPVERKCDYDFDNNWNNTEQCDHPFGINTRQREPDFEEWEEWDAAYQVDQGISYITGNAVWDDDGNKIPNPLWYSNNSRRFTQLLNELLPEWGNESDNIKYTIEHTRYNPECVGAIFNKTSEKGEAMKAKAEKKAKAKAEKAKAKAEKAEKKAAKEAELHRQKEEACAPSIKPDDVPLVNWISETKCVREYTDDGTPPKNQNTGSTFPTYVSDAEASKTPTKPVIRNLDDASTYFTREDFKSCYPDGLYNESDGWDSSLFKYPKYVGNVAQAVPDHCQSLFVNGYYAIDGAPLIPRDNIGNTYTVDNTKPEDCAAACDYYNKCYGFEVELNDDDTNKCHLYTSELKNNKYVAHRYVHPDQYDKIGKTTSYMKKAVPHGGPASETPTKNDEVPPLLNKKYNNNKTLLQVLKKEKF